MQHILHPKSISQKDKTIEFELINQDFENIKTLFFTFGINSQLSKDEILENFTFDMKYTAHMEILDMRKYSTDDVVNIIIYNPEDYMGLSYHKKYIRIKEPSLSIFDDIIRNVNISCPDTLDTKILEETRKDHFTHITIKLTLNTKDDITHSFLIISC